MERGKEIEDGEYEEYVWRRRQSSRMLQGMLKRVGHVPFHPIQEMDGAVGGAEETKALHPALSKMKPETFQTTASDSKHDLFQTTPSDSKYDIFKTTLSDSKHDLFQTTPSDSKHDLFQTTSSDSKHDLFQTTPSDSKHDLFQTAPSDSKHDLFQTTPSDSKYDIFKTAPSDSKHDLFQTAPSDSKYDIFKTAPSDSKHDLFQTIPSDSKHDLFQTTPSDSKYDIFKTAPSDSKYDFFQTTSSDSKYDLFQTTPSDSKYDLFQTTPSDPKHDLFQTTPSDSKYDIFKTAPSDSKHDFFQTTPSDSKNELFQTTPSDSKYDIFKTAPSDSKYDLFQTTPSDSKHDLFQTTPSDPKHDLFQTTPSNSKHDLFQTTPSDSKHDLFQTTPSDSKHDLFQTTHSDSKHDLFKTTPSDSKHDLFQTAPSDSKHDLFQAAPSDSKHDLFKTPLPKLKENGHITANGSRSPDLKSTRNKDHESWDSKEYPVYQNVFLIGEEKCVEDWPEDSPELCPDWKPPGRLRLRRESMKVLSGTRMEWGNQDPMENNAENNYKAKKSRRFTLPIPTRRQSKSEAELVQKGADLFKGREGEEDEQDVAEEYRLQRQKRGKKFRITFLQRRDSKGATLPETPPGATCKNYHLSEAAEAEWLSAQRDESLVNGGKVEETGGMEDGDTDSLMEWWNTVEQWDELPSDDEDWVGDGEVKELKVLAEKVQKGIHVFNKVFMEQAEGLWQHIIDLNAIAENINEFHKKAKIASITGGTTSAVGGVTAIAGLALAPVTLGASLIITAVGIGVATAGGLTSASASISDSVHNSQDRKKVERIVEDYQTKMADISKCLRYVQQGLEKLLAYNLLKMDLAGEQGLGLSRAVQMASEASGASERAVQLSSQVSTVLTGLFQGMDDYYMDKDSRELKKGCKTEFAAKIREVANRLHEALVELNSIREELQDTVYNI